jgi:hypothetical protein
MAIDLEFLLRQKGCAEWRKGLMVTQAYARRQGFETKWCN